jgi:hypothetical protein
MHTESGPAESASSVRANCPRRISFQPSKFAFGERPLAGNLADEIVRCLVEGRDPAGHEIQAVAARIWCDIHADGPRIAWNDIDPSCGPHRRMIAAARAALGDRRGSSGHRQGGSWRFE